MRDVHDSLGSGRWSRPSARILVVAGLVYGLAACDDPVGTPDVEVEAPPPPAGSVLAGVVALGLDSLDGAVRTYFSPDVEARAVALRHALRRAGAFYREHLGVAPEFHLAVLNAEHWAAVSEHPYGVPFASASPYVVVLPAEPDQGAVAEIYAGAHDALPRGAAADLYRMGLPYDLAVYRALDLMAYHELAHVYISALGYHEHDTARWFEELLATYAAYSYLQLADPTAITIWDALSGALIAGVEPGSRSLDDFNTLYVQGLGPASYGWFQSQFNLRASDLVAVHPRASWFEELRAAGLHEDTRELPTSDLLRRLDVIVPDFTRWAEDAGLQFR